MWALVHIKPLIFSSSNRSKICPMRLYQEEEHCFDLYCCYFLHSHSLPVAAEKLNPGKFLSASETNSPWIVSFGYPVIITWLLVAFPKRINSVGPENCISTFFQLGVLERCKHIHKQTLYANSTSYPGLCTLKSSQRNDTIQSRPLNLDMSHAWVCRV